MTGQQLKDELERIASGAPDVHVPDDLFDRGRRATTRARVLVAAAAVACLAVVAGVGLQVTRSDDPSVADDPRPAGVPDVIYAPTDGGPLDLPVARLGEIGPAAVAYVGDDIEGTIVLVTPEGRYRAAVLPHLYEPMLDDLGPILSPDGTQLAYSSDRDRIRRISIVDLTTGSIREVTTAGRFGAQTASLQWSPNSRWIVWSGQLIRSATENGAAYRSRTVGGVIAPDATESYLLANGDHQEWYGAGVCDDGTPIRPATERRRSQELLAGEARQTEHFGSWPDLTARFPDCTPPLAFAGAVAGGMDRLVGWLRGRNGDAPTAVFNTPRWIDGSRSEYHERILRLVEPDGTTHDVGRIESISRTSVATDLMSLDRPTVAAGESPWAQNWWERNGRSVIVLGVAALGGALIGFILLRRVRR